MRRGLVSDHVRPDAAFDEFRQDIRRIAEQPDRNRLATTGVIFHQRQRFVEIPGLPVEVARAQAEIDARLLAFDIERHHAGHRGCQRLCAAHAAEPRRQYPFPRVSPP